MIKKIILLLTLATLSVFAQGSMKKRATDAHPLPNNVNVKLPALPFVQNTGNTLQNWLFLNVRTTIPDGDAFPTQNESSIAVNPKNLKNIIASAVDYRGGSSTWVYVSHNGGLTWENKNLGKPYPLSRSTNDPSVTFSDEGIAYLMYGAFPDYNSPFLPDSLTGSNGVFLCISKDEGRTWESHIEVIHHFGSQTPDSNFEDKYYVYVDNSPTSPYFRNVYTPWKRVVDRDSATQIVFTASTDKGYTWREPINVSSRLAGSSEDTTFGQSFPLVCTDPDGVVYCVWNHGPRKSLGFSKSTDGGLTWTPERFPFTYKSFGTPLFLQGQGVRGTVKGVVRAQAYSVIRADMSDNSPRKGTLYWSWFADSLPNVYFSKSTDKGETWTEPTIVHSVTETDQFWSWMAIDPTNGDIAITYMDSREDPENILVDCWVSFSQDGGQTWVERKVTDSPFDLRNNPFGPSGGHFAGDYNGCDFYDGIIYPSWVDMRNAPFRTSRENDVYTAIIKVNAPMPVNNLNYQFEPSSPWDLKLTWDATYESSFGKELDPVEMKTIIKRDGEVINILPSIVTEYEDTELVPFQEYIYEVAHFLNNDTSAFKSINAFPGGSPKPDSPTLERVDGLLGVEKAVFDITIPSFRSDKVTPLSNLKELRYYINNEMVSRELSVNDTGTTIRIEHIPQKSGVYLINAQVFAEFDRPGYGVQVSESSDTIICAVHISTDNLNQINFRENENYRFYVSQNFRYVEINVNGVPTQVINNAEELNYRPQQLDTILLAPFLVENRLMVLELSHAAINEFRDTCVVEYSTDGGTHWDRIRNFNKTQESAWSGGDFSIIPSIMEVDLNQIGKIVLIRFRFRSNAISNDRGWFLDNIKLRSSEVSVQERIDDYEDLLLYPMPSNSYLNISSKLGNKVNGIMILTLDGRVLNVSKQNQTNGNIRIDLSNLNDGMYFIEANVAGKPFRKKLLIIK